METHNYFNLIKNNTCFKGPGSLPIENVVFKVFPRLKQESDYHHLIYSILESISEKEEPKQVICRNYKHFQWQHLGNDLNHL